MIRGFWQSRLTVCVSAGVTAALSLAIWIHDRGRPVYIPLMATAFLMVFGVFAGLLAGKLVADNLNTRCLSLLHMELDPQAFLRSYEKVMKKLRRGTKEYALACSYLAEGYGAAGEFGRATDILRSGFQGRECDNQALKGLYFYSLASFALSGGRTDEAKEAILQLEHGVSDSRKTNPKLAANLEENRILCQNRLACLTGEPVDEKWMKEQLKRNPFALRRLEILRALAEQAMDGGRRADALAYLDQMDKQAGKTWYRLWSGQMRQKLNALKGEEENEKI